MTEPTAPPNESRSLSTSATALTVAREVVVVSGGDVRLQLAGPIALGALSVSAGVIALFALAPGLAPVAYVAGLPLLAAVAWGAGRVEAPNVTAVTITLDVMHRTLRIVEDDTERQVPLSAASIVIETFDGYAQPLLRVGRRSWKITGEPADASDDDDVVSLLEKLGVAVRSQAVDHRRTLPETPDIGGTTGSSSM